MNQVFLNEMKAKLIEEKVRLENRFEKLENDKHQLKQADFAEQATESENDEVTDALSDHDLLILTEVKLALSKIHCGNYGICEESGEEIGESRLRAVPYARRCQEHA